MATILNRTQTFATNGTVTAAGLHNLIDDTGIYAGLITTQTELTTVGTADQLLIAVGGVSDTGAPRRATVQNLFDDALSAGTYTGLNLSGALTYGTATGNRTVSTSATITTGTIPNLTSSTANITLGTIPTLTAGTTTSTAANITSGTVQTLTASTGTIGTFNSTTGTIATINSTTGTIGNLSATTSTFLGTITGSTNVVNIGSGQIYKDATGNVGIGTTSPATELHVSGAGTTSGSYTNGDAAGQTLYLQDTGGAAGNGGQILFGATQGIFAGIKASINNGTGPAGDLIIQTRSTSGNVLDRLRVGSAGQIGIGGANYGTSGQVLTSNGASSAPSWQAGAIDAKSYGTSTSSFTTISGSLKMAYGTVSVGANTYTEITNLAFTSADTYVAFAGQNVAPNYANFTIGVAQRMSGTALRVHSQDDVSSTVQWLAIGT